MKMRDRWFDFLSLVAVVLLVLAVVNHRRTIDRLKAQVLQQASVAQRAAVVDRITGTYFPEDLLSALGSESEPSEELDQLIWVLTPSECPGCLSQTDEWNSLSANAALRTILIFAGVGSRDVERLVDRLRIRGEVLADPTSVSRVSLQLPLPSTYMLVAGDGKVLLVDSRYPAQACGWSFLQQLAALRRVTLPEEVRSEHRATAATFPSGLEDRHD
jgi:hypothetical protein